jgi:di/tricarboxylate transporter
MNKIFKIKIGSFLKIFVLTIIFIFTICGSPVEAFSPNNLGVNYASYSGLTSKDVRENITDMLRIAMGVLGTVAVVIVIYAGFLWMTAGGNDERVGQAKKWLYGGVIGLALILTSYSISNWVISHLVDSTTGAMHWSWKRKAS